MKAQYGKAVDSLMCTETCPCQQAAYDKSYASLTAAELSKFNRLPSTDSSSSKAKMFARATAPTYTTWGECYNATLKSATGKTAEGIDTASKDFSDFVKNGGVEFLGSMEDAFDCAGLCYTPLFYMKKSIAVGPPKQDCARAAVSKFGSNTAAGAVAIITGLVFFTAFLGSIPLCRGFHASGDDGKAF